MSSEIEILKFVCLRLDQAEIPYMLTGSFAANFYAIPRMTRDIDIVIELQQYDIERLIQIFQDQFYIEKDSIDEAIKYQTMFNIIHNESVFKIDFIVRKSAPYRTEEFKRRQKVQFDDVSIWIVTPEDLILSKLCWARDSLSETQLNDVKNIIQSISTLDKEYMQTWINRLELNDVYEKVAIHV